MLSIIPSGDLPICSYEHFILSINFWLHYDRITLNSDVRMDLLLLASLQYIFRSDSSTYIIHILCRYIYRFRSLTSKFENLTEFHHLRHMFNTTHLLQCFTISLSYFHRRGVSKILHRNSWTYNRAQSKSDEISTLFAFDVDNGIYNCIICV